MNDSTPASYFTGMYADAPDPWRLADRWYEHRKYTLTLASLPGAATGGPSNRAARSGC